MPGAMGVGLVYRMSMMVMVMVLIGVMLVVFVMVGITERLTVSVVVMMGTVREGI